MGEASICSGIYFAWATSTIMAVKPPSPSPWDSGLITMSTVTSSLNPSLQNVTTGSVTFYMNGVPGEPVPVDGTPQPSPACQSFGCLRGFKHRWTARLAALVYPGCTHTNSFQRQRNRPWAFWHPLTGDVYPMTCAAAAAAAVLCCAVPTH